MMSTKHMRENGGKKLYNEKYMFFFHDLNFKRAITYLVHELIPFPVSPGNIDF